MKTVRPNYSSLNDHIYYLNSYTLSQGDSKLKNARSHRLDISIRYTFNAQKSKYKGTGAGKAERERMSNNN